MYDPKRKVVVKGQEANWFEDYHQSLSYSHPLRTSVE